MEIRKKNFNGDGIVRICAVLLAILIVFTGGIVFPERTSLPERDFALEEDGILISEGRSGWAGKPFFKNGIAIANAATTTVTETKTITDVASYDIWKHINGTWQFGKKQGSQVTSTFTIYIGGRLPEGAEVTSITGSYDSGYSGAYSSYAVPSATINVKSFDNSNMTYSVSTALNGSPMDLRRDDQSEYTEGYRYYIPAVFEVTYTIEKEIEDEPSGNDSEDSSDSANVDGEAVLDMPEVTYEGHPLRAEDRSYFDVDGEEYSAARMYDEGLASNKFTASGDSKVKRIDDTEADITFNKSGQYSVTLTVTPDSGGTLTDRESVEVLRTPEIQKTLGGVQKENRRQVLTVLVAENPSYPLTKLYIELEKKGGSERVHLDHDLSISGGAGSDSNVNAISDLIKTRAISDTGSDSRFTRVELEFLTKNTEKTKMTYRIYAEDSRGNTDIVEKDFDVLPDMAPEVVIASENPQFREEGGGAAYVYAEDVTQYDGDDAERTWYVREETLKEVSGSGIVTEWTDWTSVAEAGGNLMDASFGSWRGVAYKKEGVGRLEFRLDVRDSWIEGTLPEYVSESDIKEGSGTAMTEVDNIAPVVSLDAGKMKRGNLLLLARNEQEESAFSDKKSVLKQKLREGGISTDIFSAGFKQSDEVNSGSNPDSVFYLLRPYGYGVEGTFIEKGWYMADDDTLYTVDGTWTQNTKYTSIYYYDIDAPYTINSYDLKEAEKSGSEVSVKDGGTPKWQITISKEQLGGVAVGSVKGIAQDDTGTYLYFRTNSNTLIYDKETGSLVADIPISLGEDNFVCEGRIYTLKSDGLYSINMRTGVINNVYPAEIIMKSSYSDPEGSAERINGEINFACGKGSEIKRVRFNPLTEEARLISLTPEGADFASTYNIIGFGANGDLCIGRSSKKAVHIFDRDGNEFYTKSGWSIEKEHDILPAYKGDGTFDYIAVLYNGYRRTGTSSSGYKYRYSINETLYDIRGDMTPITYTYERVVGASGTTGCGTDAGKAMFAAQFGNIVVVDTGNWSTCISDGSALSGYYNTSFTQMVFDLDAGTATAYKGGTTAYDAFGVGGVICEYGKRTEEYFISAYSMVSARYVYGESTNMQALRVGRLPKNEDTEISMAVNKFAPLNSASELDSSAVYVSGLSQGTEEGIDIIENVSENIGPETNKSMNITEGILVSDSEGAFGFSEEKYPETENGLVLALNEKSGSGRGILVSSDDEISTITKTYSLLPDTEYYYEIDYSGELSAPVSIKAELPRAAGVFDLGSETATDEAIDPEITTSKYYVTRIEKEDFSDYDKANLFFSGLASGRFADGTYCGTELHRVTDTNSNRTRSDSSSLTFTIPPGEKAILKFDYKMAAADGAVDETYINIDGARWYRNSSYSQSPGLYTHPFILEEGEHTIDFVSRGYGKRPISTYIIIDNLELQFVEEGEAGGAVSEYEKNLVSGRESEIEFEDSGVKGSFRTPEATVSYAGQKMTYINAKPDAGAIDIMVRNDGSSNKDLTVNIPTDKKAVFTAITLASSPVEKRAVNWTFDGKTIQVRYETTNGYYPLAVPKSFRITSEKSEGTIRAYTGNLYKVSAGFDNAEMVMVNVLNDSINAKKYIIEPESSEIFFEDEIFTGKVDFSISGKSDWALKDFRLYYIENGKRVYVEDGYISEDEMNEFIVSGGEMSLGETSGHAEEETIPVYKKGESIKYNASYYDYESDPSKAQYFRYTHVEGNDGPHPDAGKILTAPIMEFDIDGKYTVEHWQEDSCGRVDYDKESNRALKTFYIEGAASAPWIEGIKTNPRRPVEGDNMSISVSVNDFEKDPLELTTEVYFEGSLIYSHKAENIVADAAGRYPVVTTDAVPGGAKEGMYSVVCTVSDEMGTGFGFYDFKVEPGMSVEGSVSHFRAWEEKRLEYNEKNPDSPRSSNTFWANESFNLVAETRGNVSSVKVSMREYPEKTVTLAKTGENLYTGSFFDSAIAAKLAKEGNCDITFVFTATYPGGKSATDEVTVIIDDTGGSDIKIHRVW